MDMREWGHKRGREREREGEGTKRREAGGARDAGGTLPNLRPPCRVLQDQLTPTNALGLRRLAHAFV